MNFLDREEELARLIALSKRRDGGLAVLTGRRRVGKTRLLVEWVERSGGVYFVADQSSAEVSPGGPFKRKSRHGIAEKPARSTVMRASSSQSTSGRNPG